MNESVSRKLFRYILNDSIPADMVKAAWSGLALPMCTLAKSTL